MRIAFVHQLPLEIYPPARNALAILAREPGFSVMAWSSANFRGLPTYETDVHGLQRPPYPAPDSAGGLLGGVLRFFGFLRWHLRTASEIAAWQPDAVLSIEPHSALAVWWLLKWHRCRARLFIHHHEYYAEADFRRKGNRTSRICRWFERRGLFPVAEWVSQTNDDRLRLLRGQFPELDGRVCRVWPNHPPASWVQAAATLRAEQAPAKGMLRLICVGSLSFEDCFVREIVEWVAARPGAVCLHLCGHNIKPEVRDWVAGLGAENVSIDAGGLAYNELPALLVQFDAALVLYRGNTLNFIYNVPNKVIEALACGLEVWYPVEMTGMDHFRDAHPGLPLRRVDFRALGDFPVPDRGSQRAAADFSAERAAAPLLAALRGKEEAKP